MLRAFILVIIVSIVSLKMRVLPGMNHISKNVVNGYVTKDVIVIVFGMLTGLNKDRIKSSFSRMMHHVLSLVMEYLVMQPQRILYMFLKKPCRAMELPSS